MSKMITSRAFLVTLFFGLGYLFAWLTLTPGSSQPTEKSASPKGSLMGQSSPPSRLERSPGTSQSERRQLERTEHWENADMALIIEKIDRIKTFESNTFDTGLSNELCEYLAISRSEKSAIDAAIRSTVEQLQQLQISSVEETQVDDTTSKFIIRSFPDQGGTIKEALHESVLETLGENRYFMFTKISKDALAFTFLSFGEADVHITMETAVRPGRPHFETMVSSGTRTQRFETEGVPPAFAHLLQVK